MYLLRIDNSGVSSFIYKSCDVILNKYKQIMIKRKTIYVFLFQIL